MNLNIGGQRIVQTVPFRNQDFVRDVEKEVDNLYSKWRKEFHSKTDRGNPRNGGLPVCLLLLRIKGSVRKSRGTRRRVHSGSGA